MDLKNFQTVATLTCLKTLMLLFNIIFLLSGILLLALGIWLHIEFHKYVELSPEFSATAPYIFVGTGLLILFLATLACCCAVKEQPVLLYIYAGFLSLVLIVELGACISGYAYRSKLEESFERGLNSSMSVYAIDYQRTSAVNSLQNTLHCCGIHGYKDWYGTRYGKPPGSCCNTRNMGCNVTKPANLYDTGCYALVMKFFSTKIGLVAGAALGLAGFQCLGIFLTVSLANLVHKTKYEEIASS